RITGVERTWKYLKVEFDRESDGLPDHKARYYEALGGPGPKLFAVCDGDDVNDKKDPVVYYHDEEIWSSYATGSDVEFSFDPA
ncbi:unnamed protein product, partial [Didymodactylos carnosus]